MNKFIRPTLRTLIFAVLTLLSLEQAQATHIVGGEMNYSCLGNDQYQIELTIYRDCFFADPRAFFDDPAFIGIFDENNQLVNSLSLPLLNNDTIPAILNDSCLFVPASVCVHTTTYRGVITLPFRTGGYQVAYQRCCRNQTILNIIDPVNTGATYVTNITEEAMLGCNNSPKFTEWPPLFVCVNKPIDWDHSAVDVDGDSLVYELCVPFAGADNNIPRPVPTNNPPFENVVLNEPAFDLSNLLGGDPLTIDRHTGRLTAVPSIIGQFVIGVCVSEYRNGQLIGQTRRDFQYNVGECGEVQAVIVAPDVQCEDLSVSFENSSPNADAYLWNFNDPNNPGASSTDAEPTYQYSEPGTYTIQLIASTRSVCRDTSYHTIFLQRNSTESNFAIDVQNCVENSTLVLTDLSIDPISAPSQWMWSVSVDGSVTETSTLQNPVFQVSTPANIEVSLTTTSENGCVDGDTRTFETVVSNPTDIIASDIQVCDGVITGLNPDAEQEFMYQWEANPFFSDLANANPRVIVSEDFSVGVTVTTDQGCTASKDISVEAINIPEINTIADQFTICEGEVVIPNTVEFPNLTFEWSGAGIEQSSNDVTNIMPSESGSYQVVITESSALACMASTTFDITVNENPQEAIGLIPNTFNVCTGPDISLNPRANDLFEYEWASTNFNSTDANPSVPTMTATYNVTVTNPSTGCNLAKNVRVDAVETPTISIADQFTICDGEAVVPNTQDFPGLSFAWTGVGIDQNDADVVNILPNSSGSYSVVITESSALACSSTETFNITVNENPVDQLAAISDDILICNGSTMALNPNGNDAFDYQWAAEGFSSTETNPIAGSDIDRYSVTITNPSTGCNLNKSITVDLPTPIDLTINGERNICFNQGTTLTVSGNGDLAFQWIPDDQSPVSTASTFVYNGNEDLGINVLAVDEFGCRESTTVAIDVENRITALDNLPDSVLVCENIPTALSTSFDDSVDYLWSPTINIDDATSSAPIFNSDETTVYTVQATNPSNGCFTSKSLRAVVPVTIDLTVSDNLNTCGDDAVFLTATSDRGQSFSWISTSGASVGTTSTVEVDNRNSANYIVEVTDDFGCVVSDSVSVDFVGINANIADDRLETCDDELQINLADVDPINANNYEWGPVESIISGENSDSPIVLNNGNDPITYGVTITNEFNCRVVDEVVVENRFLLADLDNDQLACVDIDLELNPNFVEEYTYSWSPSELFTDPNASNPIIQPTEDVTLEVTVMDDDGCSTVREVRITTTDLDDLVVASMAQDTILDGQSTQFNVTNDPDLTYQWVPPLGLDDPTSPNPTANPSESTNYIVMITNSQGCTTTRQLNLTVLNSDCAEPYVFFPNAFTPNGDGVNDVLRLRGNAVTEVNFVIYDRWGERIFVADSIDDEWDGTYRGRALPPDVYGYYLEVKCLFGGEFKKQGNVTLLD